MTEFKAANSDVCLDGIIIRPFVEAFPPGFKDMGLAILRKYGLSDPQPGTLYNLQTYYDAMKELYDKHGAVLLETIGERVIENLQFPPEVNSLETVLKFSDNVYRMFVKGGDFGEVQASSIEDSWGMKKVKVVFREGSPCSYCRGLLNAAAKRFKPEGAIDVVVRHDDSEPCRSRGGETCTFIVSWV